MPATIDHMTTNFQRIDAGMLDHKRENKDAEAVKALKGLLRTARREVTAALKAEKIEVTPEVAAQKVWDAVIAKAVEAGVQTSIPGTRGNEFRREAKIADRLAAEKALLESA